MELFWKSSAWILIGLFLTLMLGKQERDMGILLVIAVCSLTAIAAVQTLEPVLDFFSELQSFTHLDSNMLRLLFRLIGIGLIAELIALICSDAGYASFGKTIHLLASATILCQSIPVFETMVQLIRDILGGL